MYIFISILVLIISFLLFRKASGSMAFNKLNMISFIFYLQLFLYCWIGSILVIYRVDHHYSINRITDQSIRIFGWYAVMYTMIFFPLGILISKVLICRSYQKNVFLEFIQQKISSSISKQDSYIKISLLFLTFVSFLTYCYLLYYVREIGLIKIFTEKNTLALTIFRISNSRNFGGNQYLINIFGLTITPILSYIVFCYYKISRSTKDLLWFIFLFVLSVLFRTYDLEKSPVVYYILGFVFITVLTKGKIPKKALLIFFILVLLILVAFYILIAKETRLLHLLSYNTGIGGRIMLSQLSGLYECLDIYPNKHPFIGFSSLSQPLSNILNIGYSDRAARINMEIIYPDMVQNGLVGVGNTLFIGEAWANFGFIGFLFSPLYVGFCLGLVYYLLLKKKKSPIIVGIYGYFCVFSSVTGGFNDYLYAPVLISISVIFIFIWYLGITLRKRLYGSKTNDISST